MKKTLIALAVAGFSFNAAAVEFNAAGKVVDASVPFYAAELVTPVVVQAGAVDLDVTYALEKGIAATTEGKIVLRFDLTNAAFSVPVQAGDLTIAGSPSLGTAGSISIYDGGALNDTFVTFVIATDADNVAIADDTKVTLDLGTIQAKGGNATVQVRQYDQELDSTSNTGLVDNVSGALFEMKSLTARANVGTAAVADVNTEFAKFTSSSSSATLGAFEFEYQDADGNDISANVYGRDGQSALPQLLTAESVITVDGNFAAAKDANGELDKTKVTLGGEAATTLEANKATFKHASDFTSLTGPLVYAVDGKTAIQTATYSASVAAKVNPDFNLNLGALGNIGSIVRNGSTAEVDLALAPDSAYTNLVRLTNKSSNEGKVFVTVYNDDGVDATVELGQVEGQQSVIAGNASTTQMTVKQIVDATGLALTGQNKVRLVFTSEIPQVNDESGLSVQTYVVGKDGQNVVRFN